MKTSYKFIIINILASAFIINLGAQNKAANDSTLNRQILLERDFNPTLQDASKINTLPAIHEPVIKQANIQFEDRQPLVNFGKFPIGDTGSGDIKTALDFNKKRGYFGFGIGNYSNMQGKAGYRIVDSKDDQFDIFARYNSSNGKIKYAEKGYDLKDVKAKYNDLAIFAKYQHTFSSSIWFLNGGYENIGFNYYGNPFGNPNTASTDLNSKQSVGIINAETGLRSKENDLFKYDIALKYNYFTTKYGPSSVNKDGVGGNIIDAKLNFGAPFEENKLIGVRLNILNQSFGDVDFTDDKDAFHSLTKIGATPHFDIDGGDYFLSLGLHASYATDWENKFLIAPDIRFSWQFSENTSFYSSVTGKINENTYLQMLQENRYIFPGAKVNYSRTPIDGKIGIKSGVISGFEFDIFGGYKQTNNEHLYIVDNTDSWGNVSMADYYDVGTGHFGGLLKTNLIPYTDLSAKLVGYFYNVDGDDNDGGTRIFKPWNLPSVTFDLNADFNISKDLTFSANYGLSAGRKAYYNNEVRNMKNINELNVRAEYQIIDWISLNARVNNLLNQKYDSWYGYTHQGINFMAGINLKF